MLKGDFSLCRVYFEKSAKNLVIFKQLNDHRAIIIHNDHCIDQFHSIISSWFSNLHSFIT